MHRRQFFSHGFAAASILTMPQWSTAQQGNLLRILVGFGAGSPVDVITRILAEKMAKSLGQQIIVDNRVGAAGRIAAEVLKNSPPNGTTLMVAPMMLPVLAPMIFSRLSFDPAVDLVPVAPLADFHFAVAVRADHPASSIKELIEWLKANPSKATFGSPSSGSLPHFFGLLLGSEAGAKMTHVPYNTSGQLQIGLLGGDLPVAVDLISGVAENHKANKIRVLATSGTKRSAMLPDVPTFAELGYPRISGKGWFGLFAPPKTAPAEIQRINHAVNQALAQSDVQDRLRSLSLEPASGSSAELAAAIQHDIALWGPIVKASGFRAD